MTNHDMGQPVGKRLGMAVELNMAEGSAKGEEIFWVKAKQKGFVIYTDTATMPAAGRMKVIAAHENFRFTTHLLTKFISPDDA